MAQGIPPISTWADNSGTPSLYMGGNSGFRNRTIYGTFNSMQSITCAEQNTAAEAMYRQAAEPLISPGNG